MPSPNEHSPDFQASDSLPEAMEFQAAAMRNRMLALWGAEKMGLNGASSENYAEAVVRAGGEQPSEDDVIRKVLGDLIASNLRVRESEVRTRAAEFLAQARNSLKG